MQPKKMLVMNILDILRKYTDENHRLSQKEIIEILEKEYGMTADRKAVRRNLTNLMEAGYDIEYSESVRKTPNPKTGELEESVVTSDYYLVREFTDAELRLLIDGLLFSKHIPYAQCKELVEKLEKLSNKYFLSRVKHIQKLPPDHPENKQLFYTIDILDEAIWKGKQVRFKYCGYDTEKRLVPRADANGEPREYIVNPYQMTATNGRYYLVCNLDRYDDLSNYRLDRIRDVELLDTPAKPANSLKDVRGRLNLAKHMAEHIYMFSGPSGACTFRAKNYVINDIIDYFGTDVRFLDISGDELTVTVPSVNMNDMRLWAMQFAAEVRVISPRELADAVAAELKEAAEKYDKHKE